jgi:hypothetical protein
VDEKRPQHKQHAEAQTKTQEKRQTQRRFNLNQNLCLSQWHLWPRLRLLARCVESLPPLLYSQCYKVSTGLAAFWQQREEETNVAHVAPFTQPDSSEDNATQFDFEWEYPDAKPTAGTYMDVGQCLNTGSFTDVHAVASQRGVNHTINDFVETKLLKILEDANVPHFLLPGHIELGM